MIAVQTLQKLFKPDPEAREQRALARTLGEEAKYFGSVIRARLTRLDICYRFPKSKGDFLASGVQQVEFIKSVGTPEAIYLMVDSRRLPRGVKVSDLADEEILDDLSVACRRPVRFRYSVGSGAWFIVERQSGVWGIPRRIDFKDLLANFPKSAGPLTLPLGVGENKRLIYRDLTAMPHVLIGGETGGGKSTFINALICSLVLRNSPDTLRLVLVDLKGGVEFAPYRKLPHLLYPVVKERGDVLDILRNVYREVETRLALFEGICKDLAGWNYRRRSHALPYHVLVIDELANIMLEPKLKGEASRLLADITARGRAPGVHVVLATQRPEVAIVPGLIKANTPARIAFRCATNAASMTILDDASAVMENNAPPGRIVYKWGLDKLILQGPFLSASQPGEIARQVVDAGGIPQEDSTDLAMSAEDVFLYALDNFGGDFSQRKMYAALRGKVSKGRLEALGAEYENNVVDLPGRGAYVLLPGDNNNPRRLAPYGEAVNLVAQEVHGETGQRVIPDGGQQHQGHGEEETQAQNQEQKEPEV